MTSTSYIGSDLDIAPIYSFFPIFTKRTTVTSFINRYPPNLAHSIIFAFYLYVPRITHIGSDLRIAFIYSLRPIFTKMAYFLTGIFQIWQKKLHFLTV